MLCSRKYSFNSIRGTRTLNKKCYRHFLLLAQVVCSFSNNPAWHLEVQSVEVTTIIPVLLFLLLVLPSQSEQLKKALFKRTSASLSTELWPWQANLWVSFGKTCDCLRCQQAPFPESWLFPFLQRKTAVSTSNSSGLFWVQYRLKKKKKRNVSSFLLICSKKCLS